ncbi:LOW QUALITY PROTEIN: paraneoplastic antigen-like protein 8A [Suncus etruscus]|uniref:LOW QUALITY PROTEIN: paraneoplastic antigen-like protein 8A n=1 Tax=Suncus etruscus TaxID=109475 RepID=UPI00210F84F8|nr:LOW QUALITY PROTEIN: paraneoplastic antigen-like protein 8A [Suncus etruscus]
MLLALLEDWCRGMEVDMQRALLVTGIPEDCGKAEIEETLHPVLAPLGPFAVLNRIFLRQEKAKAALVELGEGVSLRAVPRQLPGRGGQWRVVCHDPEQDADFLRHLNDFLKAEGRTWEDVGRLLQLYKPPPPQYQPPENWAEVLGVLLGAVVQIFFHMDAETRGRGEVPAGTAARRKSKTEVGPTEAPAVGVQGCPAGKREQSDSPWKGASEEGEPPKVGGRKAGSKSRSQKKKQKSPKEEGTAPLPSGEAGGVGKGEPPREKIPSELRGKQEVEEKPPIKGKGHSGETQVVAGKPEMTPKSDRDGGQEGPPKKKAMGWAKTQISLSTRKTGDKKLVPYSLANSEDHKKQPVSS